MKDIILINLLHSSEVTINMGRVNQLSKFLLIEGINVINYRQYLEFMSAMCKYGKYEEALIYQKLALYFAEHSEEPVLPREMASILHNLGCFYHINAKIKGQEGDADTYVQYLAQAEVSFKKAFTTYTSDLGSEFYTEYANFLIQNGRQPEAIELLEQVIIQRDDGKNLSYGQMEKDTVDDFLKADIEAREDIEIRAVVYAYYLLSKIYVESGKLYEAKKVISKFIEDIRTENAAQAQPILLHNKLLVHILSLFSSKLRLSDIAREGEAAEYGAIARDFMLAEVAGSITSLTPSTVSKQEISDEASRVDFEQRGQDIDDEELQAALALSRTLNPNSDGPGEGSSFPTWIERVGITSKMHRLDKRYSLSDNTGDSPYRPDFMFPAQFRSYSDHAKMVGLGDVLWIDIINKQRKMREVGAEHQLQ